MKILCGTVFELTYQIFNKCLDREAWTRSLNSDLVAADNVFCYIVSLKIIKHNKNPQYLGWLSANIIRYYSLNSSLYNWRPGSEGVVLILLECFSMMTHCNS